MNKILTLAMIAALASCAKSPDKISAVEVGGDAYARHSCAQLQSDKLKITQDLENLSAQQKTAASNDALGVFLLALSLASMSGSDKEATIAIAKGKIQAIAANQWYGNAVSLFRNMGWVIFTPIFINLFCFTLNKLVNPEFHED